jgi:hypothetical protein
MTRRFARSVLDQIALEAQIVRAGGACRNRWLSALCDAIQE